MTLSEHERAYQREYKQRRRAEDPGYRTRQNELHSIARARRTEYERLRRATQRAAQLDRLHADGYLTTVEALAHLDMGRSTLQWAEQQGHLTPNRIDGRRCYAVADLDDYLANHRHKPGNPKQRIQHGSKPYATPNPLWAIIIRNYARLTGGSVWTAVTRQNIGAKSISAILKGDAQNLTPNLAQKLADGFQLDGDLRAQFFTDCAHAAGQPYRDLIGTKRRILRRKTVYTEVDPES